jgi:hypothetical protein
LSEVETVVPIFITIILLGVFVFGLLIAVKHWIFLVSGFNMMLKEELSQFDVIKITRIIGILLMLPSALLLVVFYLFDGYKWMALAALILIISILTVVLIKIYWKNGEWIRKKASL